MMKSKNEEWGVYIVFLQEAEKTFIECAELKVFVTVGRTTGLERRATCAFLRVKELPRPKV
jgi:hypothetical protein